MSTTNTVETNGTANGTANGEATPVTRTRTRSVPATGSKFTRLWALAGKASTKRFTLKRETEEGTFSLKMDGHPATLTPDAVAKLAQDGAKLGGKVTVGAASGNPTGILIGSAAADMVAEMTAE
jgi:hypothetical protein